MKDNSAQVIIVGGGPVGGALACALAQAGISSIIIDRMDLSDLALPKSDGRAIAVNSASQTLLKNLSVWQHIPKDEIQPIQEIHTLNGFEESGLLFQDNDGPNIGLGCIVEMPFLKAAILKQVQHHIDQGIITWVGKTAVTNIHLADPVATVTTDGPASFTAPLVVGADGKMSTVRQLAGFDLKTKAYHQTAIVTSYQHSNSHDNKAYEIFLPHGPFAILPMTRNRSSVVWSLDQDIAASLLKGPESDLDKEITTLMSPYLNDLKRVGKIWSYPLSLSYTQTCTAHRCVLVGDAAHAIHPLAGQGVNLGFKDVAALTDTITDAFSLGLDYGSETTLQTYEKKRKWDVKSQLVMTDSLNTLFSNSSKSLNFLRSKGLKIVNRMTLLKNSLEQQARGLGGARPSLMKGDAL